MKLEMNVREQRVAVSQIRDYTGAECGYAVHVTITDDEARVTLCQSGGPLGEQGIGILSFNPGNVAAIERFAEVSNQIFSGIAFALREHGLDDLRGSWQKRMDEIQQRLDPGVFPGEPEIEELRRRGSE